MLDVSHVILFISRIFPTAGQRPLFPLFNDPIIVKDINKNKKKIITYIVGIYIIAENARRLRGI